MTLSHDEFERVCDHFALLPKRGVTRMEIRMPAMVAPVEDGVTGDAVKTSLRDVSLKGATLLHRGSMKLGAHVALVMDARWLIWRVDNVKRFVDGSTMIMLSHVKLIEPPSRVMGAGLGVL